MNLTTIKQGLVNHAPKILLYGGVASVGVGTILACRAWKKTDEVIDEHRRAMKSIETQLDADDLENGGRLRAMAYAETAVAFGKLYAPAAIAWVGGIACIFKSDRILNDRNLAIGSAYVVVKRKLDNIEKNLIAEKGEEFAKRMMYGTHKEDVEYEVVDGETGEIKTKKGKKEVVDTEVVRDYVKIFDAESSSDWKRSNEYNLAFISSQERLANQLLSAKKVMTLNDVYELLGFEPTIAGQMVGWRYDLDDPTLENCIDFGVTTAYKNGIGDVYEEVIMMDFNVDGLLFDPNKANPNQTL